MLARFKMASTGFVAVMLTALSLTCLVALINRTDSWVELMEPAPQVVYVQGGAAAEQRKLSARMHMHYEYVPENELPAFRRQRAIQTLTENATAGEAGGASPAAGNASAAVSFYPKEKDSCAISNLVRRAEALFPLWDVCGYMKLQGGADEPGATEFGVISAPSNDTNCTDDKMGTAECREEFTRSLLHNGLSSLSECLLRIRGLSQTCDLFDSCGPVPSYQPALARTSVCRGAEGYYKEEAVERMCGICGMFRASTPWGSASPTSSSKRRSMAQKDATNKDGQGGGCFAVDALVDVRRVDGVQRTAVGEVQVGEYVWDGRGFSRVYFVHNHADITPTITVSWEGGSTQLTRNHRMMVPSSACKGGAMCRTFAAVPAGSLREGDAIYVTEGGLIRQESIVSVSASSSYVRYILTESSQISVGDAVASVCSTGVCTLETLPFRFLDGWLLQLPAVKAALAVALDSPLLAAAQRLAAFLERTPRRANPLAQLVQRSDLAGASHLGHASHLMPVVLGVSSALPLGSR